MANSFIGKRRPLVDLSHWVTLVVAVTFCGCSIPRIGQQAPTNTQGIKRSSSADQQVAAERSRKKGLAFAAAEQDAAAISQLEQARTIDPNIRGVAHPLAVMYDRQERWSAASREYQQALEESPHDANLLNDYGYFLYSQGSLDEAEQMLLESLQANPAHEKAELNLGMVLAAQGLTDEAFSRFESVVGTAAAHHNLGVFLARAGRKQEAMAHLQRAIDLDPGLRNTIALLAHLERNSQSHEGAIRQACWESPSSP